MEETSEHGVLGRHQSFSEERIEVLSDAIERYHPLQYTPSLLYPEGFHDGNLLVETVLCSCTVGHITF